MGKRMCCTAVVQDMASGVSKRAHLKGCHFGPACLVVSFSVWVVPTQQVKLSIMLRIRQSSAKATGNIYRATMKESRY